PRGTDLGALNVALDRLRSTWESLGRDDPLWAVLSDPDRRGGRWDLAEFLDTGREHAALIRRMVDGAGRSLGGRVLDFGCGVGGHGGWLALQCPSQPKRPQPLHPAAYRARIEPLDAPQSVHKGQPVTVRVRVTNVSEHTWPADQRVTLGNHWFADGRMLVQDD